MHHPVARSYNKYLAVAARVVRRSLKDEPRLKAERRGQFELKFAKWEVRSLVVGYSDAQADHG